MSRNIIQKELDKNKFFFIKYAFVLNTIITGLVVGSLFLLKIAGKPIFLLFIKYYIYEKTK